jgi:hypothetical protein
MSMPASEHPVLFHPDYDRRLRDRTGSADLGKQRLQQPKPPSARGLHADERVHNMITAGGELHPAPRTLSRCVERKLVQIRHQQQLLLYHALKNAAEHAAMLMPQRRTQEDPARAGQRLMDKSAPAGICSGLM